MGIPPSSLYLLLPVTWIRVLLFFMIIGVGMNLEPTFAMSSEEASVRVRIASSKDRFQILAVGFKTLSINEKNLSAGRSENKKSLVLSPIEFQRGNLKWQGKNYLLRPGDRVKIQASLLQMGGSWLGSELEIHLKKEGLNLVKKVGLEDYLLGVLSKEVPLSWPQETLKAQAVASLSYVLARQSEQKKNIFDVEASVLDQHYDSEIFKKKNERVSKVRALVREVLSYRLKDERGQILKAYFHADCGGATVSAHKVWGGPSTPEVQDPFCQSRKSRKWVYEVETNKPLEILKSETLAANGGSGFAPEGRISKLSYEGKTLSLNEFRQLLGFDRVRSGVFEIEPLSKKRFRLKGIGHGHGVGLCQQGSFIMGQIGKTFKEILKFYYPQSSLVKAAL